MKKQILAISASLILSTSAFTHAQTKEDKIVDDTDVFMEFFPSSAPTGTSVTLFWESYAAFRKITNCRIYGVPGLSYVTPIGEFTLTASQNLDARLECDAIGDPQDEPLVIHFNSHFTLAPSVDFDLRVRKEHIYQPGYVQIYVVNPVNLSHCSGDGLRWIATTGYYDVTCIGMDGLSKTKSAHIKVGP